MNAMAFPNWLEWVHALGWTLLHFLWQGALVGAAYGLLRWILGPHRAQARYVAGLVALAILALLPLLTLAQLAPHAGANYSAAVVASDSVASDVVVGADGAAASGIEPWLPWLVSAWLLGVGLSSLRALAQYWKMRRLCEREAEPLLEWNQRLQVLCRRFGVSRPVRLVKSMIVQTPSLIGWIKPIIVLPTSVLVGLTPQQIELVIAHELGHIRRWDYAVNLLQIALETVLFYHPVVHWISRDVRNEREACCDDLVLRLGANPVDYATTLASLEELRGVTHAPMLAASGGFLLGRIRRIVGVEPMFAAPLSGGQGILALAIAFAAFLAMRPVTHDVLKLTSDEGTAATAMAAQPAATAMAQSAALTLERALSVATATATPTREPVQVQAPTIRSDVATAPMPAPPRLAPAAIPTPRPAALVAGVADIEPVTEPSLPPLAMASSSPRHELVALARVAPAFPREARLSGQQGRVELTFSVDGAGRARDIEVVTASIPGVFDRAAVTALRGWRFDPDTVDGARRYAQRFDFSLGAAAPTPGEVTLQGAEDEPCRYVLGSRICRRGVDTIDTNLGTSPIGVVEDPRQTMFPRDGMSLGGARPTAGH